MRHPKDKVCGFLGMTEAKISPKYSPDVTAHDVYHEEYLLQIRSATFEVLSCVDHKEPRRPSWVPE